MFDMIFHKAIKKAMKHRGPPGPPRGGPMRGGPPRGGHRRGGPPHGGPPHRPHGPPDFVVAAVEAEWAAYQPKDASCTGAYFANAGDLKAEALDFAQKVHARIEAAKAAEEAAASEYAMQKQQQESVIKSLRFLNIHLTKLFRCRQETVGRFRTRTWTRTRIWTRTRRSRTTRR